MDFAALSGPLIEGKIFSSPEIAGRALVNPFTEEPFHTVRDASPADADAAVKAAHECRQSEWAELAPGKRAALLFKLAELIDAHADEIGRLDSLSMGKPLGSAQGEARAGAATFRYYAGAIGMACGEVIPVGRGGLDFTLRQPLGVAACIVPWNFPFVIACWKTAPALAAGNCVLLKPAMQSPLGALVLGQLALEAGFPPAALQVLCGDGAVTGESLVRHPLVRKISFTGSTAVGRRVMQLAADDFKRVSLELGGKSPNIVFADSDWERAADTAPMSVFDNTGQDCCARSRMFIERSIYEPFMERFAAAAGKLRLGDPGADTTDLGPLVSADQLAKVEGFVNEARTAGRRIVCGGSRPDCAGYFYEPTIIDGVDLSDRCWREEIFGPVACVRPFDSEADMIAEVNASPYGLSGSIWTRDISRALRVARRVEAGVLSINCHNSVHTEAPFGGFKQSGMGRDLGMAAMHAYTEVKNIYLG